MSTTLFIDNDTDKSIVEEYDCQCQDYPELSPSPCPHRCENGIVRFTYSQWETNLSNSNFGRVMKALGYEGLDCGGSLDADTLVSKIAECDQVVFDSYVTERIPKIREIAKEAQRRGEKVCWG
jgi:hypothetical protein